MSAGAAWRCPVTGGLATRMTAASFTAHCEARRNNDVRDWRYKKTTQAPSHPRCGQCGGERENWPPELVIVELAALTTTQQTGDPASLGIPVPDADSPGRGFQSLARPERETSARGGPPLPDGKPGNRGHISSTTTTNEEDEHMAKRSDKMADCELCGQKAQLESSHNFNVCPTCFKVMQYTRNHPDKIAAAARMLGKDTELAQALGMSDGAATTTSEGAAQLEAAVSAAMQTLHNALPADLHDLDRGQTHSFLDIEELAKRAAREIAVAKNAGRAWRMLMDEVETHGLKVTATEPDAMIRQFADELNTLKRNAAPQDEARTVELETRLMEAEREQDRLRERLRERLKTCNDPTEDALLQWAIRKYQAGKITLQIEVQEMETAA